MKFHKHLIVFSICFTSSTFGARVILDFNFDPDGRRLLAGDGTLGSGFNFLMEQPYDEVLGEGLGITFFSENDVLTLFDSTGDNGEDPDLEFPHTVGNNLEELSFGNLLIIQTTNDGEAANNIDIPNDSGNGGEFRLFSDIPLMSLEVDIIDVEEEVANDFFITVSDSTSNESVQIVFQEFEGGSGSIFSVDGAIWGDGSSNRITSLNLTNLQRVNPNLMQFDTVNFDAGGSFGIAQVLATPFIPEPSTSLLGTLSILLFLSHRKR